MNSVRKILGDDVELDDFLSLDINIIKNLLPSQKKELIRLQKELEKLNEKDLEDDKQTKQRKNDEKIELEKVKKLLGEDINLLDFIDLDIPSINNLNQQKKQELLNLQDKLENMHEADIKDALTNIESRKKLECDELKKAGEILKNPDLMLEEFIDLDIGSINITPVKKKELKHLQDDLKKLHKADFDGALKDSELRKDLEQQEMISIKNILKDPEMTAEEFIDVNIDKLGKISSNEKKNLARMQDELKQLHKADLMDTMVSPMNRKELEVKDLEAARVLLKNPLMSLDEFLDLYIPGVIGLNEDEKKALLRLQEEEELMHKKDIEDAMDNEDMRHNLVDQDMETVKKILGPNVNLNEFLNINIDNLKDMKRPEKKELIRIQNELKTLDSADKALKEDKMSELSEEDALVAKASKFLGDSIELIDLLGLEIDKLPNLSKS